MHSACMRKAKRRTPCPLVPFPSSGGPSHAVGCCDPPRVSGRSWSWCWSSFLALRAPFPLPENVQKAFGRGGAGGVHGLIPSPIVPARCPRPAPGEERRPPRSQALDSRSARSSGDRNTSHSSQGSSPSHTGPDAKFGVIFHLGLCWRQRV